MFASWPSVQVHNVDEYNLQKKRKSFLFVCDARISEGKKLPDALIFDALTFSLDLHGTEIRLSSTSASYCSQRI